MCAATELWLRLLPAPLRHRLSGRADLLAIIGNSGWLLFDKLFRGALGLLVGAWAARYLGPASFGTLAYVLAFIALFQSIANLGADAIVVRELAHHRHAACILGTSFFLRIAAGTACWLAAIVAVALIEVGNQEMLLLTAVVGAGLVFQAADTVDLWFQSHSQSRRTVMAKLVSFILSSIAKVLLIVNEAPLMAFAVLTAFEAFASAIGLAIAYRQLRTHERWSAAPHFAKTLLKESWPYMLSGLSIMAYARLDQILLKKLVGEHALGIYAAALPISQFSQLIPLAFAASLAPWIARLKLASESAYREALVIIFRVFFYLGIFFAVMLYFLSDLIIGALFGQAYAQASYVLIIHSVSNIFCFLGIAHGLWLINEGKFAVRLVGTLIASLCSVGANYVLLPRVGLLGAAYSAVLSQLIAAFLINAVLDRPSFRLQLKAILFTRGNA